MHKVDNRRRTCLPVFDPFYRPSTDRRGQLPLIQQQQQEDVEHWTSSEGRHRAKDVSTKTVRIKSDVNKNAAEDSKPGKTKKLRRKKVVKWKSLNVDNNRQRRSDSEQFETTGIA